MWDENEATRQANELLRRTAERNALASLEAEVIALRENIVALRSELERVQRELANRYV
jgi:dynactin complex subunit